MNWHFSRAMVAAYLAENSSDGKPSVPSKSMNGAESDSCKGKTKDTCHRSQSGMMSEPSMASRGVDWWMSSLAASRAKTSASETPAVKDLTENAAGYGRKCGESFAKFDPASCSWKTRQTSLIAGLDEYSESWPRWGMMQNGECWASAMPEGITNDYASGLSETYPTPTSRDTQGPRGKAAQQRKGNPMDTLPNVVGGVPHPRFSEWLMGWPIGFTNSEPLETDKIQQWCALHGVSCEGANS